MSPETSNRIEALRFPLILGVVYIHAEPILAVPGSDPGAVGRLILRLTSEGLFRAAVPLFFLVAGYLFFVGNPLERAGYFEKLRRRKGTLLTPYVFWNGLNLAGVALALALPFTRGYVDGGHRAAVEGILSQPVWGLARVFGIGTEPMAYQFWFIRDLMVLVLLAPLIRLAVQRLGVVFLGALGVAWLFRLQSWVPSEPVLSFSVGAALALWGKPLFPGHRLAVWSVVVFVGAMAADLGSSDRFDTLAHRVMIAAGCFFSLGTVRWWTAWKPAERVLVGLAPASFFVFAVHEPLLTIVEKPFLKSLVADRTVQVVSFLALPILVVLVSLGMYGVLRRWAPKGLAWVTGGLRREPSRRELSAVEGADGVGI